MIIEYYIKLTSWWWRWNRVTSGEGISGVSRRAAANRVVVHYLAYGVESAGSWAWVDAFVVETCLSQRAFRADHALWSALRRATDHSRLARAHGYAVIYFADAVRSTW